MNHWKISRDLIKKDPENMLYPLDDDWLYFLEHPDEIIETEDTIFLKRTDLKMSDLDLLDVIKKEHPKSIKNLSAIMNKDIKVVQPKVSKLAESGLIKLEPGLKNAKNPWLTSTRLLLRFKIELFYKLSGIFFAQKLNTLTVFRILSGKLISKKIKVPTSNIKIVLH